MTNAYKDPEFAKFWHHLSGDQGQAYKQYVLDPAMFRLMGSCRNKVVMDLGCGNGYLGPRFVRQGAKRIILLDGSKANLVYARKLNRDKRVEILCHDATRRWPVKSSSVDIVYSDMLLNELRDIQTPLRETFRVLRSKGRGIIAVTHPAWDLFEYAKTLFGKKSIIENVGPYFYRRYNWFLMNSESLKPRGRAVFSKTYRVEHYQRPIQDYVDAIVDTGLQLVRIVEPPLTQKILLAYPGYREMIEHPIGLIFSVRKI